MTPWRSRMALARTRSSAAESMRAAVNDRSSPTMITSQVTTGAMSVISRARLPVGAKPGLMTSR